ncbi:MAG: sodium-translocating pyrophosphatase [Alphaproteobacteria bacterium]|nr:sodium-translocating pyrophosphatase [Alphaproteobacteria bacterium]MBR3662187.1 sodium-translocating pyrophosphatase [Alphaproteobacteria bacterium]
MLISKAKLGKVAFAALAFLFSAVSGASASEMDLNIPHLSDAVYDFFGYATINGDELLKGGMIICLLGMIFGLWEFFSIKKMPAHKSMLSVSETIYATCTTYMKQQAKLLFVLEVFIAACIVYYFAVLNETPLLKVLNILLWSVLGILGSYTVAWFGMRINTYANSRTSFASLQGKAFPVMHLPLRSGMSIGVLLICVELIMMMFILVFVPRDAAGACFIGFAIGESLGASALRICGGIFTKIADIGADLMKIIFKIDEDDARNPGVIADCTGDNAGDSCGPTADGFETYGVTGVALISFIVLAAGMSMTADGIVAREFAPELQARLITWIFTMRILMIITSVFSYAINNFVAKLRYGKKDSFDFEAPLTSLIWLTSIVSIAGTFGLSYMMLPQNQFGPDIWWELSVIISCGTLAAAIIPEFTKIFTSSKSQHVQEVVNASREAGASLNIISGIVAGNFSGFWQGFVMAGLMAVAYLTSTLDLGQIMIYPTVFAFGLVAFGMLGMGPVTIAVDSYGPVTDNAQSVFELSQIEQIKGIKKEIKSEYGFEPDFEHGKHLLEANDSAGNTFKATSKPVLIGTAVIGATTMIFSIILLLQLQLNLIDARVLIGLILGGAVIYWFSGASIQAVSTGAYRAVNYIKEHIKLDTKKAASVEDSKTVVKICTQYAQKGMFNIFIVIFSFAISFACFSPEMFASYLISIAVFGLYQALFMANAGGAWDNAKKVVEVDLNEKGTELHAASVVGDTVGDPYKDTASVALNPIIKFTTLFGLLAAEMAAKVSAESPDLALGCGVFFLLLGLVFVWRSFYAMRIEAKKVD